MSKDALALITKVASNDEIYQNPFYSAKDFCKLDVLKELGENKTISEVEIQLKKAQINQIYFRTYKHKRLLLFLDDKNSNKYKISKFFKIKYFFLDLN